MNIGQALAPLVDLVYPPRCPSCGEGLAAQEGLCPACWAELVFPPEPACALCQNAFDEEVPRDRVCEECRADPPPHDALVAGTLYTAASRKLVLAFKHGGKIALAPMLARMIVARLPELQGEWLVVPVPLHRMRLWRRGYNQAALLARHIAKGCGQRLAVDALVRKKATPPLGGLGRLARAQALAGAIAIHPRHVKAVRGARVILVDDVMTSGATTGACVQVLRQAGARTVLVACFARVMDEAL